MLDYLAVIDAAVSHDVEIYLCGASAIMHPCTGWIIVRGHPTGYIDGQRALKGAGLCLRCRRKSPIKFQLQRLSVSAPDISSA
jgi:hypothetical protein